MAADEAAVWKIIEATLAKHMAKSGCDRIMAAWQELYDLRNFTTPSYDPEALMLAEHYLYARSHVCNGEYPKSEMDAMVYVYEKGKQYGPGGMLQANPEIPTTPSSDEAIVWGLMGSEAGEHDRLAVNPKSKPTFRVPLLLKKKVEALLPNL